MKEAKTQKEFEELSKLGDWFYVTEGSWQAWGQAHVVAREQAHVVAWGQAHVEATSPHVSILAKSSTALLSGGYVLGDKTLSAKEWLSACSVKVNRGKVILYKSLSPQWTTQNDTHWEIGQRVIAPDWDINYDGECGRGLHFSPTVAQAKLFRDEKVYIACEVAVKDMASLPAYAQYPDKIRARECKVLYQVNENGETYHHNC